MNEPSRTTASKPAARRRLAVAYLAGLTLLSACAVQRGVALPPMADWETRREVLSDMREWMFTGRIGVSAGDEGFNGTLRWHQTLDRFQASVSGPLGAGAVRIEGDDRHVTVSEKAGDVTELTDPEAELRAIYGWTIPVASLRYWALGIPDPGSPAITEFGTDGRLARLDQRGWVVNIGQYREDGGQPMPRRISAVNADTKVRLVIDDWTFY